MQLYCHSCGAPWQYDHFCPFGNHDGIESFSGHVRGDVTPKKSISPKRRAKKLGKTKSAMRNRETNKKKT